MPSVMERSKYTVQSQIRMIRVALLIKSIPGVLRNTLTGTNRLV
jgi:hypothetical protein